MGTDKIIHADSSENIIGAALPVLPVLPVLPKPRPSLVKYAYKNSLMLTIMELRLALLMNFKFADLRWERVVR